MKINEFLKKSRKMESSENSKKVEQENIEIQVGVWDWEYRVRRLEESKVSRVLDKDLPEAFQFEVFTLSSNYLNQEEIRDVMSSQFGLRGVFQVESVDLKGKAFVPMNEILKLNIPLLQKNKFLKGYNNFLLRNNNKA